MNERMTISYIYQKKLKTFSQLLNIFIPYFLVYLNFLFIIHSYKKKEDLILLIIEERDPRNNYHLVIAKCDERYFNVEENIPHTFTNCNQETKFHDCKEAVPYLNFIIDHYDSQIAHKYIFIHAHRTSWHYKEDVFKRIKKLVDSEYFVKEQYNALFPEMWCGEPASVENMDKIYQEMAPFVFSKTSMLDDYKGSKPMPCCASFAVDSNLFYTRTKEEYIQIRENLKIWSKNSTEKIPGDYCSRLMEWTWHILFTKKKTIQKIYF